MLYSKSTSILTVSYILGYFDLHNRLEMSWSLLEVEETSRTRGKILDCVAIRFCNCDFDLNFWTLVLLGLTKFNLSANVIDRVARGFAQLKLGRGWSHHRSLRGHGGRRGGCEAMTGFEGGLGFISRFWHWVSFLIPDDGSTSWWFSWVAAWVADVPVRWSEAGGGSGGGARAHGIGLYQCLIEAEGKMF